ncbi:sensor histidine kinase [Companilactobacillus huachuanensis]|uniref:Sensor histidine kinase n=1 Tax=Companilactobacillus huachuanensis TaxID=2559914 RepID=A0ABW1RH80_9LACO|nr:GHKL domain-containing protein [Companilactobacillus huachuanensis]
MDETYLKLTVIIIFITIIFISTSTSMFIYSHVKGIRTNLELKQESERDTYIKELEKSNDELRKFKHDYKNLLLSLSASINNKDDKDLKSSVEKLLNYEQINIESDNHLTALYKLDDKLVKGILISKLMQAKSKNIKTDFEVDKDAQIPSNYSVDITRILGILLDNAIDACLETDNPELDFALISFDNYLEFVVKNNVKSNDSINTNNVYKSGYTTKKNHSGLGLASLMDIVDSNKDFIIQTENDNGYYSTIITISKGK